MKKGKYYILPLDSYNQPNGNINEIFLTKEEFEELEGKGYYIYKNYASAAWRAQA